MARFKPTLTMFISKIRWASPFFRTCVKKSPKQGNEGVNVGWG